MSDYTKIERGLVWGLFGMALGSLDNPRLAARAAARAWHDIMRTKTEKRPTRAMKCEQHPYATLLCPACTAAKNTGSTPARRAAALRASQVARARQNQEAPA
jgi:hypothetical protein